jgi:serine/threonine protein kinase
MYHLETLNYVHRDLAARNCLIDERLNVKIGDLGMAQAQFAGDYAAVRSGEYVLPVRWMACEAIVHVSCLAPQRTSPSHRIASRSRRTCGRLV